MQSSDINPSTVCIQMGQCQPLPSAFEVDEEDGCPPLCSGESPHRCRTLPSFANQASCKRSKSQPCARKSTKLSSCVTSSSSAASEIHLICRSMSSPRFI